MGLRALPPGTKHIIVGGPCVVLAVGARRHGDPWGGYSVDEVALRHGAGHDRETSDAGEAYARFAASEPARYQEGWLP
jgi:hypothetical protein